MQVSVVKASTTNGLENKINDVLNTYSNKVIDIKVSGAYDGNNEIFIAVIMYEN
ncbi:hypothetical protein [Bacillus sp. BHET2]|uniref:hypothetical protein n=1 Tax=Bacillus sp. BHET2 TaxID=2583818 RepID=UPI0014873062|nr:hypothetical protein [Bacillus sp. BHET2]